MEKKTAFEELLLKDRSFRGFDNTCKIEKITSEACRADTVLSVKRQQAAPQIRRHLR